MSALLTDEVVRQIIDALRPSITELLKFYKREFLHVCVQVKIPITKEDTFGDQCVLFYGPLGGPVESYPPNKPYHEICGAKTRLAAKHQMNTGDIVMLAPQLLERGDVIWQGGVYLDGISVGASGGPAPMDEAVSMMIACNLRAYCQVAIKAMQERALKESFYAIPKAE